MIGHEANWRHAKATQSIVDGLNRLGIDASRREISQEVDFQHCDFVYAELLVREPVVDVLQLLNNPYLPHSGTLALQLRKLARATNWQQAREQLHAIHATVHAEQAVIPLWQIQPHFAVRRRITGVGEKPMTLYQGIRNWRLQTESSLAFHEAERQ